MEEPLFPFFKKLLRAGKHPKGPARRTFYREPEEAGRILLRAGEFAIVPPEDAHAPRRRPAAGPCAVKKIVIKIRL